MRHHSTEALNFQLTFLIFWLSGFVAVFVTAATATSEGDDGSAWILLPFGLMFIGYLTCAGLSILGAVRAGQGKWWRYPLSVRFVRGARPRR